MGLNVRFLDRQTGRPTAELGRNRDGGIRVRNGNKQTFVRGIVIGSRRVARPYREVYCGAKISMQPQPPPSALLGTKT